MAISYEEALSTLQAMFSDQGYASHQLDAVLRHFGGHMEHTVETLLSHGEGTPDELIAKLSSLPASGGSGSGVAANSGGGGGGGGNSSFDADEELARQLQAEDEQQQQQQQRGRSRQRGANQPSSGLGMGSALGNFPGQSRRVAASTVTAPKPTRLQPPPGTKGRGAPTVLPYDFLRIPGKKYPSTSATTTTTTTATSSDSISDPIASANGPGGVGQMMSDEQLARMLQDELFQEELRNNPEFSHLAGRRNPSARSTVTGGGNRVAATRSGQTTGRSHRGGAATGGGGGGGVGWGERTDFFDRLSDLGDNAKRRFQHFASSWNDPNAQTNRRPLFGGGGVGGGQTTTNRGNESRGLLSNDLNMDEDEEEMDFVGGATGGSRDFEMNDVGSGSGAKINWSGDKKID